jgi:hypothetical protein
MWHGMDPNVWNDLERIRELVKLRYENPTRQWPLVFVEEFDALLVVREWPGGQMTAYATSEYSEASRNED